MKIYEKLNKKIDIEIVLLTILIIICSYQSIIAVHFPYLDEIAIMVLSFYEIYEMLIMKRKKINVKKSKMKMIFFLIFIGITLVNCIIKNYNVLAYFEELLNYLKVIILIEVISLIDLDDSKFEKVMKIFIFINLISIVYGLIKYVFYKQIGYTQGDMFRNGYYRFSGIGGHSIAMGFTCLIISIYLIEKKEKSNYEKIVIVLSIIVLYLTYSRLPQALFLIFIILKIVKYIAHKFVIDKKNLLVFGLVIICIFSLIGVTQVDRIKLYLEGDLNNTIRFYALQKASYVFQTYPILGTGIGTFSSNASVKYNSYVYEMFEIDRFADRLTENSGNIFESYLAKVIIETGVIGVLFYAIYFGYYLIQALKTKNNLLSGLIAILIINAILNTLYQIPFVLVIAIFISNNSQRIQKEESLLLKD